LRAGRALIGRHLFILVIVSRVVSCPLHERFTVSK
jgi:hypothetical protein